MKPYLQCGRSDARDIFFLEFSSLHTSASTQRPQHEVLIGHEPTQWPTIARLSNGRGNASLLPFNRHYWLQSTPLLSSAPSVWPGCQCDSTCLRTPPSHLAHDGPLITRAPSRSPAPNQVCLKNLPYIYIYMTWQSTPWQSTP
jgi:hypothetical protein